MQILSASTKLRFNAHLNHACYAMQHDYTYRFDNTPRALGSVYEHKIRSILDCPPDGKWWFWLDDDAFFTQFETPLESLPLPFDDDALLILAKSPINPQGGWTFISSGNFFFRPSVETRDFFQKVLSTNLDLVARWWDPQAFGIFTNGDQDQIVYCLMNDRAMLKRTRIVPYNIFNTRPYHFSSPQDHFLAHFAVPGVTKAASIAEFQKRFSYTSSALIPSKYLHDLEEICRFFDC